MKKNTILSNLTQSKFHKIVFDKASLASICLTHSLTRTHALNKFILTIISSLFGAPLGGYARATRSRLAALPVRLVGDTIFWENEDATGKPSEVKTKDFERGPYFTMRDGIGRQFACHVYDEDDLTSESVSQSMFDIPISSSSSSSMPESSYIDDESTTTEESLTTAANADATISDEEVIARQEAHDIQNTEKPEDNAQVPMDDGVELVVTTDLDSYTIGKASHKKMTPTNHDVDKNLYIESLAILDGSCSQLHLGWWSYEWCHNGKVTQFHIQVQTNQMDNILSVKEAMPEYIVQSVSTIGTFTKRKIVVEGSWEGSTAKDNYYKEGDGEFVVVEGTATDNIFEDDDGEFAGYDDDDDEGNVIDDDDDDYDDDDDDDVDGDEQVSEDNNNDSTKDAIVNVKVSDVMVADTFENGEYCEEAKANRAVEVRLRCCTNEEVMDSIRQSGGSVQNPNFFSKPFDDTTAARAILLSVQEKSVCNYVAHVCTNTLCAAWTDQTMEEMMLDDISSKNVTDYQRDDSIRYILDKTLSDSCLKKNEGWWAYSFCYQSSAYQYHESINLNVEKGAIESTIEAKHVLGKYDPVTAERFPNEDEVKHIIFPQGDLNEGLENGNGLESMGLDSAYFVQEYIHGDLCEGDDVIDSAIKGGEVGEGGIERSTTIRFFCGNKRELVRINEDRTCHYVVDITVPELCTQKYFERPHIKKHAVKCVPV